MKTLTIVHLYPREMNIYGDTGNRLIIEKRLAWRQIPYETKLIGVGEEIPAEADIIIGGGGQDAGQAMVEADLLNRQAGLQAMAKDGVVMLMVCGLYQLFGHRFVTHEGNEISGIGVLDIETIASSDRFIGNIHVESPWGILVGYENHSGKTYLGNKAEPLGKVLMGAGNNGSDHNEGARSFNVFGTYMHGPVLSKNPVFADALIKLALERQGDKAELSPLNDNLEDHARSRAAQRPR